MGERLRVRRSQRLLQFFALGLLALGTLSVLPIQGGWVGKLVGVASLAAGISGVLGLSLSWHRALLSFTVLSWLIALSALGSLLRLALSRPVQTNPLPWISWLANLLLALPAAVLASTMHILRVWKPSPIVTGDAFMAKQNGDGRDVPSRQLASSLARPHATHARFLPCPLTRYAFFLADTTAPLVDSAADCEPAVPVAAAAGAVVSRLAWPPPRDAPSVRSADVQTALRMSAAVQSDCTQTGGTPASCVANVARHGSNSTTPAVPVWPPPLS